MRNTVEVKQLCNKIILHFDLKWVIQYTGNYAIILWNKDVESYHIKKSSV